MKIITQIGTVEKRSISVEYSINAPVNAPNPYKPSVAANLVEVENQEKSLIGGIL